MIQDRQKGEKYGSGWQNGGSKSMALMHLQVDGVGRSEVLRVDPPSKCSGLIHLPNWRQRFTLCNARIMPIHVVLLRFQIERYEK